jgi:hypothetical protein
MVAATITAIASALLLVVVASRSIHLVGVGNLRQVPDTQSRKTKANGFSFSMPTAVYQATGEAACWIGFGILMRNDSHGFLTCAFNPALQHDACWKR